MIEWFQNIINKLISLFHKSTESLEIKEESSFEQQVGQVIINNHNRQEAKEAFIFGISGRWGEGKTFFLNNLSAVLEKSGFQIINIIPWKYGKDRDSLIQHFLDSLYKAIPLPLRWLLKGIGWLTGTSFPQYHDVSEKRINLFFAFLFCSVLLVIAGVSKNYFSQHEYIFSFLWWQFNIKGEITRSVLSTIFLVPIITIVFGITNTQHNLNKATTITDFDKIIEKVLRFVRCKRKNKKICVFVDDLDRMTPEDAREVIDVLRTFFDRKDLSFIVTGDHTILERYLGSQLTQDLDEGNSLSEGRRYMKKMFNVYWRLPRPTDDIFKEFVKSLVIKNTAIDSFLSAEESKKTFSEYMVKYYLKNYREVERFIEKLNFMCALVKSFSKPEDSNDPYLDILNNPMLFVRMAMYEDLVNPIYEEMLKSPSILERVETSETIEQLKSNIDRNLLNKLTSDQQHTLVQMQKENDKFYNGVHRNFVVQDISVFLYFAVDSSFSNHKGITPESFVGLFENGSDNKEIMEIISLSGEPQLKKGFVALTDQISKYQGDDPQYSNYKKLFESFDMLPNKDAVSKLFLEVVSKDNLEFCNRLDAERKIDFYYDVTRFVDISDNQDIFNKFQEFVKESSFEEFERLLVRYSSNEKVEIYNAYLSQLITSLFVKWYQHNKQRAVELYNGILPKIKIDSYVVGMMDQIKEVMLSDFYNGSGADRNSINEIVTKILPEPYSKLEDYLLQQVESEEFSLFDYVLSFGPESFGIDLDKTIVKYVNKAADEAQLISRMRKISDKIRKDKDSLWLEIYERVMHLSSEPLKTLLTDPQFAILKPTLPIVKNIHLGLSQQISETDLEKNNAILELLKKESSWLWKELGKPNAVTYRRKIFSEKYPTEIEVIKESFNQNPSTEIQL